MSQQYSAAGSGSAAPPPAYAQATTAQFAPQPQQQQPPQLYVARTEAERLEQFRQLASQLEVSAFFAAKLRVLEQFTIVVVIDDSGSMSTPLAPLASAPFAPTKTRWQELRETMQIVCKIAMLLSPQGIDFFFLNRGVVRNVNNIEAIESAFAPPPQGYTPTQACLRHVFADKKSILAERRLLCLVATDGQPTDLQGNDDVEGLTRLLNHERSEKIHISFLACTDDPYAVEWLNTLDEECDRVDVCDDYASERAEILKVQGPSFKFSRADWACKALLGSVDPEIDALDEEPLHNLSRQGSKLAASRQHSRKNSKAQNNKGGGCVCS